MIHLDTHVVAWLFAGTLERLPPTVKQRLEAEELAISPMVMLELQYLHEIGRTSETGPAVVADLAERIGLRMAESEFSAVAATAAGLSWTRDPFDRLIAAHSLVDDVALLTSDQTIRDHLPRAVWDSP